MHKAIILSCYTVAPVLKDFEEGKPGGEISLDLGLTKSQVTFSGSSLILPDKRIIGIHTLRRIEEEPTSCFSVEEDQCEKIALFSGQTNRYYSLYPTFSAPTMLLSGTPMHRIKDTNPVDDTRSKIKAMQPVGFVLDTSTGLGYTAIQSAQTAQHVITIELDPVVIELCKLNPWSSMLFDHPRISLIIGDSYELVQSFPDQTFTRVLHDPPTFSLAGDLYSGLFYAQVYRILKPNGRLFHYIGDLESHSGRRVSKGVMKRLSTVGFRRIISRPEAFGIIAYKN